MLNKKYGLHKVNLALYGIILTAILISFLAQGLIIRSRLWAYSEQVLKSAHQQSYNTSVQRFLTETDLYSGYLPRHRAGGLS